MSLTNNSAHIAICFAMLKEAAPFIQEIDAVENLYLFEKNLPMRVFQARFYNFDISVITSGVDKRYNDIDNIGCEPATLMSYEALRTLSPDLVISAGTAGGFKNHGAHIGKVYLSQKAIIFHDRHVPLASFSESAIGHYPCVDSTEIANTLNIDTGIVSSGSSLKKSESDLLLIKKYSVVAKEMEAAAIAWVAMLFNTPFLAIKSITNIVDEENKSEEAFIENFDVACDALLKQLLKFLRVLDQNQLIKWRQNL